MRERTLMVAGGGGVNPSESAACDICFYDNTSDKLLIVQKDKWNTTDYPANRYTPIGIVVVPGSHNVYGDGSCGVMSLKYMDYSNPDVGSISKVGMCWGGYEVKTILTDYTRVPYVGSDGIVNDSVQGTYTNAHLPSDSDSFTAVTNPYDLGTKYYFNSYKYAPSPYVKAESSNEIVRNPLYYQTTSPSSTANCLSDFNGVRNTEVLTSLATGQSNWKTASTISNSSGATYYPAACCCWRYSTEGTKQGDWYLPAAGELGYVIARLKAINETISTLSVAYGSTQISYVNTNAQFWSSTEHDSIYAVYLDTFDGGVSYTNKSYYPSVRCFLRMYANSFSYSMFDDKTHS